MNDFEKLIETLKAEFENSNFIREPDWSQITSWTAYVPKELRKAWNDIPHETQILIYYMAFKAYRNGA
jgi:hypothetical protein